MRWFIALALPIAAFAQIQDLATTADGSVVYFSSAYRQKGTTQPGYLKIFRMDSSGLTLFRELTETHPTMSQDTNFYLAERPSLSTDGSVVAYTLVSECFGGSHCIGWNYDEAVLTAGSSDKILGNGTITISPDGKSYLTSNVVFPTNTVTIGNTSFSGYAAIGDGLQSIANGGIAIFTQGSYNPVLLQNGQITPLSLQGTPAQVRLDAAGDMFIYTTTGATLSELRSYTIASATDVILASTPSIPPTEVGGLPQNPFVSPSLTLDGTQVSYVLNGILFLQSTGGGGPVTLTTPSDGSVVDAIISGNGNAAFAAMDTGRLLRIDLPSGPKTELIAAVPQLTITGGAEVPGAQLTVSVTSSTGGDPALIGANAPAPIVARTQNSVTLQIPWEATPGSTVQLVLPSNPSPLEQVNDFSLATAIPAFYTQPSAANVYPPVAIAAHQDFSGLVTSASPATPGEIVHLYATGLGPVSPAIATGAVTPSSPLHFLNTSLSCEFMQGENLFPATLTFAGLAPGMIGIEQVDMEIRPQLTAGNVQIDCQSTEPIGIFTGYLQLPIGGPAQ